MSVKKSQTKSRLALIAALVALVAAAAALSQPRAGRPEAVAQTAAPAAQAAVPATAAAVRPATTIAPAVAALQGTGMRAYIDPVTGQLREPEQEELAPPETLRTAAPSQAPSASEIDIAAPSGGVLQRLDDSHLTYTVATIGNDGTVRIEHAEGGDEARAKLKAGARRPVKEVRSDR